MVCVNSPCSSTSKLLKSLKNSEKGVTSRRQSKNYRQCNSQRKWTKSQTRKTPTKQYTDNWIGQPKPPRSNPGMNACATEGQAVPASLITPVLFFLFKHLVISRTIRKEDWIVAKQKTKTTTPPK